MPGRPKVEAEGRAWGPRVLGELLWTWKSPQNACSGYKFCYFYCTNLHSQLNNSNYKPWCLSPFSGLGLFSLLEMSGCAVGDSNESYVRFQACEIRTCQKDTGRKRVGEWQSIMMTRYWATYNCSLMPAIARLYSNYVANYRNNLYMRAQFIQLMLWNDFFLAKRV